MRSIPLVLCILAVLIVPAFSQSIFDDQNPNPSPAPSAGVTTPESQHAISPATQPAGRDSANGTADKPKLPVPDAAALKAATALLKDAYGDDLAAAKTPDQKKAMFQKLLDAANDEKGANRYALLVTAKDLAVDAGDLAGCDSALDGMEASFDIDSSKLRSEAYTKIAPAVRTSADQAKLCQDISATVHAAITADQFDIAAPIADLGLRTARTAGDPVLVKQATVDVEAVRETEAAYADVRKSQVVLAGKPSDPDANLKVGKYRCFIKGDWQNGLPMLALGNDATLKALAGQELAGVTRTDEKVKLADGWWNFGGNETGLSKQQILSHAGMWYEQAIPQLSGLVKTKVAKRLNEVQMLANEGPRVVDLLSLVDVQRDAVNGNWRMEKGALISDGTWASRIEFSYQPPEEYDFRVVFTRTGGINDIHQICTAHGRQFSWLLGGWDNTISGFETVGGQLPNGRNSTARKAAAWLNNGEEYTSVVKVRKTGVEAYLNGKLISAWKTDFSDMGIHSSWALRRNDTLGVGSQRSPTIFSAIEVIEVTGGEKTLTGRTALEKTKE